MGECWQCAMQGGGIPEADIERVWSYGYTTVDASMRLGLAGPFLLLMNRQK